MWNTSEDKEVYQRGGESWIEIGKVLWDVLQKATHN